jgi:PDZ domain-containing protein
LIQVHGYPTYGDTGKLIMTTVSFHQLTALTALAAWWNPDESIISQAQLYPPGTSQATDNQRSVSEMDTSKLDATYLVLSQLANYPKNAGRGALIESVVPGCPAEGRLYAGDLIQKIDGTTVADATQASSLIKSVPVGRPIDFTVSAAGKTHDVKVTRGSCPGEKAPLVGITSIDNFPFSVQIASGNVGGPSAGLMFSLGLYDLLTPGDLTSGRTIAGTGTIALDGTVGPIGGIGDKIVAARDAGAQVFLCPKDNYAEAQQADAGAMKIVPVATFDDALHYLQGSTAP